MLEGKKEKKKKKCSSLKEKKKPKQIVEKKRILGTVEINVKILWNLLLFFI